MQFLASPQQANNFRLLKQNTSKGNQYQTSQGINTFSLTILNYKIKTPTSQGNQHLFSSLYSKFSEQAITPTGKEFWNLKSKDQTIHFSLPISTFDSFNFEIKTSAGGTIASVLPKLNVHFRIKRYSEQAIIPENKESLSFLAMKVSFTILCLMAKKRDWSCLILQKGLASLFGLLGFDEKEQRFTTMPHRIRSSPWSHTCPPSWTCSSSSRRWSPQWTLSSSSYTWTSAPSWPSFPWVLSFEREECLVSVWLHFRISLNRVRSASSSSYTSSRTQPSSS